MLPTNLHDHLEYESRRRRYLDAVAAKLTKQPHLALVGAAKIDQWLAQGHKAQSLLLRARSLLLAAAGSPLGLKQLLAILQDDREESRELADSLPLRGLLGD